MAAPFPPGEEIALRERRRIRVYLEGAAGAPAAIFLCHGAGGRAEQWRLLWPRLARPGARLIAWDMPGHGHSPRPHRAATYAGDAMAGDFIELVERFGARRNLVVAHSYGARLALSVLQRLHEQGRDALVERAALLGVPHPGVSFASRMLRLPAWVLALLRRRLERGFRAAAWHESADPALIDFEERRARRNSLAVFKALALQAPQVETAALGHLDLPVLILAGDSDRLTPVSGAQAVAKALPRAELHVLERCGHQIMLERPGETLARLEAFLGLLST